VHVLGAIESRRSTGADAICSEGLDGLLFERLVGDEVVEVVGREVCDDLAAGRGRDSRFRAGWTMGSISDWVFRATSAQLPTL
jgi:hypothetical protein